MSDIMLISHLLLWAVVIVLVIGVLALTRTIGILTARVPPARAMTTNAGPDIGNRLEEREVSTVVGERLRLVAPGTGWLVLAVSSDCPTCEALAPALKSIARDHSDELRIALMAIRGEEASVARFVERSRLHRFPVVIDRDLTELWNLRSTPYAVLIDAEGVVRAKGIVNNREQLDSLILAELTGWATAEDGLRAQGLLPQGGVRDIGGATDLPLVRDTSGH